MRLLSAFPKKRFPFLFAFLLPPQIQDFSWAWETQGRQLRTLSARSLESLSPAPLFHRFFFRTPQLDLRYPDAVSGEWFVLNTTTSLIRSQGQKWKLEELDSAEIFPRTLSLAGLRFRVSNGGRRVELLDPKNPGANAWLLDLPTTASHLEWGSDDHNYLYALARDTREIFVLNPRSMRSIRHMRWDPSVEITDVVACGGREQLIVEQPRARALTRVVRLRDWVPTSYTVFDLSQGKTRSDVSKTLSLNCRDIYFAGPYGIHRVQY
jgi:hypothetical protein